MKDTKTVVIVGVLIAVIAMSIAYAAFASNLQINGTAKITSDWKVVMTRITSNATGSATDGGSSLTKIADDGLTGTFTANLQAPGDQIVYTVTVENQGSIDAEINAQPAFDPASPGNDFIEFEVTNVAKSTLVKKNGETADSTTFTVTARYKSSATGTPTTEPEKTATATVKLSWKQKTA